MKKIFIFLSVFLFLGLDVTYAATSWYELNVLDEVKLVDGTTWYVVSNSDSNSEDVSLIPAYNLDKDYSYDALTDYIVSFNENDGSNTYYAESTIRKILDDGFRPVLLNNLNDNFKYSDSKEVIEVVEVGIIGSNDLLRVAKAVNYQYALNTKTNAEKTGESSYVAPEWLYRETFWMAEDGWYSIPMTMSGLSFGYVKKATDVSTEKYGIKPYVVLSKKYISGQYKLDYSEEVILEYVKDLYNEGEVINFEVLPGYSLDDLVVKVNDDVLNPLEDGTYTFTMPAKDSVITVSYTSKKPIEYKIIYDLDGGKLSEKNPTSYTIETDTFTINNPTKEGYKFIGWVVADSDEVNKSVTIEKGSIGDLVFIAKFEKIEQITNPNTGVKDYLLLFLGLIGLCSGLYYMTSKKQFLK